MPSNSSANNIVHSVAQLGPFQFDVKNVNGKNVGEKTVENSFTCYYTNIQSINNKLSELKHTVEECKPYIIGITESWLKPDIKDAEIRLNDYDIFRCDRNDAAGGGALLYLHTSLTSSACPFLDSKSYEDSVWRIIKLNDTDNLLVGVLYRSTNSDDVNNEKLLQLMADAGKVNSISHVLIMGDFNFPEIKWNEMHVKASEISLPYRFYELSNDLFLNQHVTEDTRFRLNQEPSLLDLVFSNEEAMVERIVYESPIGKSDHVGLKWTFHCSAENVDNSEEPVNIKFLWHKADFGEMNTVFSSVDWEEEFRTLDVEKSWEKFKEVYQGCVKMHVPTNSNKVEQKSPWFRKKVKESVRKKNLFFHKYRKSKSYVDKLAYIEQRNATDRIINDAKKQYESEIMRSVKTQPKRLYSYMRGKQKVKAKVSNLEKSDGTHTKDDPETCEVLSSFFSSVFTREPTDDELPEFANRCEETVNDIEISEEIVLKKLASLKVDKSQGPDEVNPQVLKECRMSLVDPLTRIFKMSLDSGILPSDFKKANISPIFKKGSRSSPGNYRPVSVTSIPGKILESIIRDSMVTHLERNELIADEQHGFVKGKSCLTNLLETLDDVTSALDLGEGLDMIYLDYSKAFDSVPHKRLIYKLSKYGFGDKFVNWIRYFLMEREQTVSIRGHFSKPVEVLSGVPQGSVLGPLLFVLYVNDIPEIVYANVKMFADDTKLYDLYDKCYSLQDDLDKLMIWSSEWLMKFNESKCKVMHIG
ncbi:MAG: reverse transcriptase family protein, partial [Sedimenticola sp.]